MRSAALTAYVLFDVFLIVVLARILGNLMARIRQPRVVGEILAGILLGPTLLGQTLSEVIAPLPARPWCHRHARPHPVHVSGRRRV